MRYQVKDERHYDDFEITRFSAEEENKNVPTLTAESLDKWLTVAATCVALFLFGSSIYGVIVGDFSGLSVVWSEVKTPLFAAAVFLVRGKIDGQT